MSDKTISPFPRLLAIWRIITSSMPDKPKVLDFGCGNGSEVMWLLDKGVDAFGCDIKFKQGEFVEKLHDLNRIRIIDMKRYALPFPDEFFDLVISNQVLEHVQNYDETTLELLRILKPGGVGIHIFPPRLKPIEAHVFVPFSSLIRNRYWMAFWVWLGFRKASDKNRPIADVVEENVRYLNSSTNYQSGSWILRKFRESGFSNVYWGNRLWLECGAARKGRILLLATKILPFVLHLHIALIRKILITIK